MTFALEPHVVIGIWLLMPSKKRGTFFSYEKEAARRQSELSAGSPTKFYEDG
jgi:hypothetical protein